MIPLSRDRMRSGIILMIVLKNVIRLKLKFTPPVKKLKCWPKDPVVEQDYHCCFNILCFLIVV